MQWTEVTRALSNHHRIGLFESAARQSTKMLVLYAVGCINTNILFMSRIFIEPVPSRKGDLNRDDLLFLNPEYETWKR